MKLISALMVVALGLGAQGQTDQLGHQIYTAHMPDGDYDGVRFDDVAVTILAIDPHSSGKTVIRMAITNFHHTAITEDRSLFKLADSDGNLYDPSDVPAGVKDDLLQRQVNPGVTIVASVAFETPPSLGVAGTLLSWRAPITGKSISQEMAVMKGQTPTVNSNTPGMTPPQLFYAPEPAFTDEARRERFEGTCVVSLVIDEQGNATRVEVVVPVGHGLDEKAVEAVKRYRFKPATLQGKPVPLRVNIEVHFKVR